MIRQHSQLKQVMSLYYIYINMKNGENCETLRMFLKADGHTKNSNLKCGDIYLF